VIRVPWLQCKVWRGRSLKSRDSPAPHEESVSPVVKEKSYFAPKHGLRREQESEPCRGADLRQRRDPRGSGGVVPKVRVAAETGLESNLFSQVPRRVLKRSFVHSSSAGGEDEGYFACDAGDAGSNPATGIVPV
jgi:hypothetical protein